MALRFVISCIFLQGQLVWTWVHWSAVEFLDLWDYGYHGFFGGFQVNDTTGYLLPYSQKEVVQIDLAGFSLTTDLNVGFKSFNGGFAHGNFGYLVPYGSSNDSGTLVRFQLDLGSFDVMDLTGINPNYKGYNQAFVDGAWGYLVPRSQQGRLIRFQIQPPGAFQSMVVEELHLQSIDPDLWGFAGGFSDGTYGYVIPFMNTAVKKVARFLLDFSGDSVEVLSTAGTEVADVRFYTGFQGGDYGFLVPWKLGNGDATGLVGRFRLDSNFTSGVIDSLDVKAACEWEAAGFNMGVAFDGYGYLAPGVYGTIALFSLTSFSPESVRCLDLRLTDTSLKEFRGVFVAAGYLYLVPKQDKVARVPLFSTTTTTFTASSSSSTSTTASSTSSSSTSSSVTSTSSTTSSGSSSATSTTSSSASSSSTTTLSSSSSSTKSGSSTTSSSASSSRTSSSSSSSSLSSSSSTTVSSTTSSSSGSSSTTSSLTGSSSTSTTPVTLTATGTTAVSTQTTTVSSSTSRAWRTSLAMLAETTFMVSRSTSTSASLADAPVVTVWGEETTGATPFSAMTSTTPKTMGPSTVNAGWQHASSTALSTTMEASGSAKSTKPPTHPAFGTRWSVYVLMEVQGLTALATSREVSPALTSAIEESILAAVEVATGVSLPRFALRTKLLNGRHLQGAAQAGTVETGIDPGTFLTPSRLFEGLSEVKSALGATIQERFQAASELAGLELLGIKTIFAEQPPALEEMAASALAALLPQLGNGTDQVTTALDGSGTVTVAKVEAPQVGQGVQEDRIVIHTPNVEVLLPAREIFDLLLPGEPLLLSVVTAGTASTDPDSAVRGSASISLMDASGGSIPVTGLSNPIEFRLPVNYTDGITCEFWNEGVERWSGLGTSLSDKTKLGDNVWCQSTHLTIFGAIFRGFVATLQCSQLTLFTPEAMAEVLDPAWLSGSGLIFYACFLAASILSIAVAAKKDRSNRSRRWSMEEFFLIPCKEVDAENARRREAAADEDATVGTDGEVQHMGMDRELKCGCIMRVALVLWACLCSLVGWCKENALMDAIDEIVSEYFKNFAEIRSFFADMCAEVSDFSTGRCTQICWKMTSRLVVASSRRSVATSLRLSLDTVDFVLGDGDLRELLVDRLKEKLSAGEDIQPASGTWYRCSSAKAAWARLHADVGDKMLSTVETYSCTPCVILQTFAQNSPLGLIYMHDIFTSCKMRMWFHLLEIVGGFVVASIFFEASGSVKAKKRSRTPLVCSNGDDEEEDFFYKMGSSLAVALGSVLIAGLPVSILESFHTRSIRTLKFEGADWKRQLKAWRIQDTFIWTFGAFYILVGTSFIALLLANIGEDDQQEWAFTAVMTLVWGDLVLPLAMAVALPCAAEVAFLVMGLFSRVSRAAVNRAAGQNLLASSNLLLPHMSI